jgi:hypothetical protein
MVMLLSVLASLAGKHRVQSFRATSRSPLVHRRLLSLKNAKGTYLLVYQCHIPLKQALAVRVLAHTYTDFFFLKRL